MKLCGIHTNLILILWCALCLVPACEGLCQAQVNGEINGRDRNGETPLRYATEEHHDDIINLLKRHGAR